MRPMQGSDEKTRKPTEMRTLDIGVLVGSLLGSYRNQLVARGESLLCVG